MLTLLIMFQTFVDASTFSEKVACFNVTSTEFTANDPSSTASTSSSTPSATNAGTSAETTAPVVQESEKSSGGLSGGAKAGIAVGAIVGAALIFGAAFFALRRKRSAVKDAEAQPPMGKVVTHDAASIGSAQTAH